MASCEGSEGLCAGCTSPGARSIATVMLPPTPSSSVMPWPRSVALIWALEKSGAWAMAGDAASAAPKTQVIKIARVCMAVFPKKR